MNTRTVAVGSRASVSGLDLLAFSIGLLQFTNLSFGGSFPLGEIACIVSFPFILHAKRTEPLAHEYRTSYILIGIWAVAQLVSNLFNHVPVDDMVKGMAAVVMVFVDLVLLRLLLRGLPKRQVLFGVGLLLGDVLRIYSGQSDFTDANGTLADNWKFGWGQVISVAAALVCCFCFAKRRYLLGIVVVFLAGSASLYYNARSQYLLTVLSVLIVAPIFRASTHGDAAAIRRAGILRFAIILVIVAVAGGTLGAVYSYSAGSGVLGEDARRKYEEQAHGSGGLLFEARPEIIPDLMAIRDSPLRGYGYHGEGSQYAGLYAEQQETSARDAGYTAWQDVTTDEIPAHSYLLCTWVWSGLFGAIFWFYVLYIIGRSILEMTLSDSPFKPYYSMLATFELWCIFCSPFGLTARMQTAFTLVVLLDVIRCGATKTRTLATDAVTSVRNRLSRSSMSTVSASSR